MPFDLDAPGLRLRPWSSIDPDRAVGALLTGYADPQMARFVSWSVRDPDEAVGYLDGRRAEWVAGSRCSWAILDVDGAVVGEVGVKELEPGPGTARMAVWTHPAHRGQGVAARAVRSAADHGLGPLGLTWIGYTHSRANTGSARVAENAGFRLVGPEFPAAPADHPRSDRVLWVRTAPVGPL